MGEGKKMEKNLENNKLILRLQHILTGLGYGCKCSGFQTHPYCPVHFQEKISKSKEDILKEILKDTK